MGWLAAGGCTFLLAGFVYYKIPSWRKVEARSKHEIYATNGQVIEPPPLRDRDPKTTEGDVYEGPRDIANKPTKQTDTPSNTPPIISTEAPAMPPPAQTMMPPPPRPSRSSSPPRLKPPTVGGLTVPPRPGNGAVRPPPSAASSLRVPATKPVPNAAFAPTSSIMPPGKQVSRKVILEPGHSPLDWAALAHDPKSNMRGRDAPGEKILRVTPTRLKMQNGRKGKDAWTVYQGKVYNISPYVPFHPGGAGEILRGAGKDSLKLFMEVHPWVNWDGMLSECLVGILVGEDEQTTSNSGGLDDMD
jgi:cytochrome b involved in lipid metabolism